MPLDPSQTRIPSRHRVLLMLGEEKQWWVYESENPPGYTDPQGITYDQLTYTIRLQESAGDFRLTLFSHEVDGFALATAWQLEGEAGLQAIAYREGFLRPA